METPKVNKQQVFLLVLSSFVFLLLLGKHFLLQVPMDIQALFMELFAVVGILGIVYYTDRTIKKYVQLKAESEEVQSKLQETLDALKKERDGQNQEQASEEAQRQSFENIESFFANLPGYEDKTRFCNAFLSRIAKQCELSLGLFYTYREQTKNFCVEGNYGLDEDTVVAAFEPGEGLHGEAVKENEVRVLEDLPEDYFSVHSGLGSAHPKYLYILPIGNQDNKLGLIELASFKPLQIKEYWEQMNERLIALISANN
jgi:hypothetical protein